MFVMPSKEQVDAAAKEAMELALLRVGMRVRGDRIRIARKKCGTKERISWAAGDGSGARVIVELPTEEFGGENSPTVEFHGNPAQLERRQAIRSRSVPRPTVAQEIAARRIAREDGPIAR